MNYTHPCGCIFCDCMAGAGVLAGHRVIPCLEHKPKGGVKDWTCEQVALFIQRAAEAAP